MGAMTVIMMRISMLSCNAPVRPACTFTWISSTVPRIPFTSHIIGDDGLQTDSHKFDSILSMDLSTSLVTLQECLRIVQLAFTTAHLRSVTKETSEFV